MPHPLRGLAWEERFESAKCWTCRFRTRLGPGALVLFTLVGGLVLLFLGVYGGACRGGGIVPSLAVLLMVGPILLCEYISLREALEPSGFHRLRLDRGGLTFTFSGGRAETAETSRIAAFVADCFVVKVLDREGACLLRVYTSSPELVARRLRSALAQVREPRSYRT